jgi:hypothetical protein
MWREYCPQSWIEPAYAVIKRRPRAMQYAMRAPAGTLYHEAGDAVQNLARDGL